MKSPSVSELEPNQSITTSFLVHSKEIRQKKTGELYLSLLLGDRTGELDAKMWDNVAEVVDTFDRDDFVKVKGLIQIFHNRPQFTIHKLRRMDDSEVDFGDYFPSSKRDPQEMWAELRAIVGGMTNPHLKALLDALLDDEDIGAPLPHGAGGQADPSRLPGRADRARALAVRAGPHGRRRTIPDIDLDLLLAGRGAARYRQDLRAELRARLLLLHRRPVDRAHQHRHAHGGRQAARPARFSAAAAHPGGAHDSEPSRAARIRLAQAAAVSRGSAAALPGRHGFQDGMHARADRKRPPGGRLFHRLQHRAGAAGAEDGPLLEHARRARAESAPAAARERRLGRTQGRAPGKPDSPFADKLRQAVSEPATPKQET